ncbi:MAG: preprotein translocase subunit SecE [Candidatus Azobacteroides sp.]|nr:preprotein translocase subunit SecE [Candidatus Azobacteroides sp.]
MKKFFADIKASYEELVHKVSWPTGSELSNSAVVVLFASLIMAVAVFCIDIVFENVMNFIYTNVF